MMIQRQESNKNNYHTIDKISGKSDAISTPDYIAETLADELDIVCEGSTTFMVWWAIRDSNPGPTDYEPHLIFLIPLISMQILGIDSPRLRHWLRFQLPPSVSQPH